jgi:hypothetical protein
VTTTFSSQTLKGPVSGAVILYTRDVADALTGDVIRDVPVSSWSVWDDYLQARRILPKFSLNRLNYLAMADILLPRAVGYAAGFLDAFFRGFIGASYEDQKYRISVVPETMVGDFQLLYDDGDGTRRPLTSWNLRLEPDELSSPLAAPQLPPEAPSSTRCWLVFRGQLGLELAAVAGSEVVCPFMPPPPPQSGTWAEYSCFGGLYVQGSPDLRYRYATADPTTDSDGLPVVRFFPRSPIGEATCTLVTWSLPAQPPNTVTSHPF